MTDPYMSTLHKSAAHTALMLFAIGLLLVLIAGALTIPLDELGGAELAEFSSLGVPPI